MHVSPPVRGTSGRHPGLANLQECPKNCRSPPARVSSHSRADSFRRVSPGSGIVWLLCRTPLFSPNPAIRGCSSRGDSQHHAVFPPACAEAFNEHEDRVLSPELGEEDAVQLGSFVYTGLDLRAADDDRGGLFHRVHAGAATHPDARIVAQPPNPAVRGGRRHNQVSGSMTVLRGWL